MWLRDELGEFEGVAILENDLLGTFYLFISITQFCQGESWQDLHKNKEKTFLWGKIFMKSFLLLARWSEWEATSNRRWSFPSLFLLKPAKNLVESRNFARKICAEGSDGGKEVQRLVFFVIEAESCVICGYSLKKSWKSFMEAFGR